MSDNGPGRPSKYNEERHERMVEAAKRGATMEGVARAGGIHISTLYEWMDEYPELNEDITRARSQAEMEALEDVADNRPDWLLERSFNYTKKQEIEHSAENVELNIVLDDEDEDDD